ncbi:MAG TPA: hypothetical protein VHU81_06425 [Thermoanaerobaculia bacterium]|nr:hypothetical protein [Thermoanaerobaculia bacterium]
MLNTYVRKTAGGCGASGFPPSQRTVFKPATLPDNVCGKAPTSYSATTGFVVTSEVQINTSAATSQPCRTGDRWVSVWLHEFGHSQGFGHRPDSETDSCMHPYDDGITVPSQTWEKPRQASIYGNNARWW